MKERWKLVLILAAFALFYFLPVERGRVQGALLEGFLMLQEYARLHVLLCLVPAFFIAGAIQNFISKEAVLRYFGPRSNKVLAYSIASVSGAILAVWVQFLGTNDVLSNSMMAAWLLQVFPFILGLLPAEFDVISGFFA